MIHHGDLFNVLPTLSEASVDACVTDPPYELGFMGKHWDGSGVAFRIDTWQQVFRVLKPGAYLAAFGGTRTAHRMYCAIEDAGFQIRDSLCWLYGQGFPKSYNLGDGKGTALKPAHEPIALAWKPFSGSIKACHDKHGTAALSIDACRIGFANERDKESWQWGGAGKPNPGIVNDTSWKNRSAIIEQREATGRWPSNVLLDEEAAALLDEQSGELTSGELAGYTIPGESGNGHFIGKARRIITQSTSSKGGASRFYYVVRADCVLCDMPTDERDTMNGCKTTSASTAERRSKITRQIIGSIALPNAQRSLVESLVLRAPYVDGLCERCVTRIVLALVETRHSDSRSAVSAVFQGCIPNSRSSILSRSLASFAALWGNTDTIPTTDSLSLLFGSVVHAIGNCTKPASLGSGSDQTRFLYSAKPSRAERNEGIEHNGHPTVKPVELMRWLVRLVTPIGGTVLDPFAGSGTTGMACAYELRPFIGIEREAEYVSIAERRIAACVPLFSGERTA